MAGNDFQAAPCGGIAPKDPPAEQAKASQPDANALAEARAKAAEEAEKAQAELEAAQTAAAEARKKAEELKAALTAVKEDYFD